MYRINGVDLNNSALGWKLKRTSATRPTIANRVTSLVVTGRDGFEHMPTMREETSMMFVIDVPNSSLDPLLALMTQQELTITHEDKPGVQAKGRLLSATPEASHRALEWDRYAFLVEIPLGKWEATTETTSAFVTPTTGGTALDVFPGLTAPVQGGYVRFRGPLTNPQVIDSSGAHVSVYGDIAAGTYVRYDLRTARAWATTSDTWTGGTEVSGTINTGGPRHMFEIQPYITPGDPESRRGALSLRSEGGSGAIQVRGKTAYLTI